MSQYVSDGTPSLPINANIPTDVDFEGIGFNVDEGIFIPAMASYDEELQAPVAAPINIQSL